MINNHQADMTFRTLDKVRAMGSIRAHSPSPQATWQGAVGSHVMANGVGAEGSLGQWWGVIHRCRQEQWGEQEQVKTPHKPSSWAPSSGHEPHLRVPSQTLSPSHPRTTETKLK